MMMTRTTDVGYSKQKQYQTSRARRHSVKKDDRKLWVTLCEGTPATREYKGWVTTVNCQACRKALGLKEEKE